MEEEEGYSNGATTIDTDAVSDSEISPSIDTDAVSDSEIVLFEGLPDDVVAIIVSKLSATASCPADYFNLRFTCKRLNQLGLDPSVLSKLSPNVFPYKPKNWGKNSGKKYNFMKNKLAQRAYRFMKKLVLSGNLEAIYTLGMIMFYIHKDIRVGRILIGMAAQRRHPLAMWAMFVIRYNGSGVEKNLRLAENNLIAAALSGHVEAIREMGYRFLHGWDGFECQQDPEEGRRLLLQAMAKEIVASLPPEIIVSAEWGRISVPVPRTPRLARGPWLTWIPQGPHLSGPVSESDLPIESDFGWGVPPDLVPHPVNRLLGEWFEILRGTRYAQRLCSGVTCSRPESRILEFFRCPGCQGRSYCSRACQDMDWRSHHLECIPNYHGGGEREIIGEGSVRRIIDEENNEDIAVDEIKE